MTILIEMAVIYLLAGNFRQSESEARLSVKTVALLIYYIILC